MTTEPLTITAFLERMIAADEDGARRVGCPHWRSWVEGRDGFGGDNALFLKANPDNPIANHDVYGWPDDASQDHAARHDPARVLAQCKAHRAIVAELSGLVDYDRDKFIVSPQMESVALRTLRALASIWSDHPSYDSRWAL